MMQLRKPLLRSTLFTALLTMHASSIFAQTVQITPVRVESSAQVEKAMQENKGRATTNLEGNGETLKLTYQAEQALTIYMVPLNDSGKFAPTDFLIFTLPASDDGTAEIDLTVSAGWSPRLINWQLNLLTKDEHSRAGFVSIEFVPASSIEIVRTIIRHIFTAEPYTPSSYHALYGYKILAKDATMIVGIGLLISCVVAMILTAKIKRLRTLLAVILVVQALYGLRFSVDTLRFTHEHLAGYAREDYDEAGSIYAAAKSINDITAHNTGKKNTVFVCRTGTNYKEKILRYLVYPTAVTAEISAASTANLILALDSDEWKLETIGSGTDVLQFLQCRDITLGVRSLQKFPDGSILFAPVQ